MTPELLALNKLIVAMIPTVAAMGLTIFAAIGFAVQWSRRRTCR